MLDPILASVRRRLDGPIAAEASLRTAAADLPPARDFAAALSRPGLSVIAEFKRRSPSAGPIGEFVDLEERVAAERAPHPYKEVDSFPVTPPGKVQKYKLSQAAQAEYAKH